MRQLTSVDAQFLALENAAPERARRRPGDPRPAHRARTGSSSSPTSSEMIAERLPLLPPLRWRLAEVPFGLDYPYWIDDPDFDLDFHVRELALPPPGTDEKLAEQVARIVARPLDRARPLWELYLIHGLEHGHVAMLTKIHHAADRRALRRRDHGRAASTSRPEGRELPASRAARRGDGEPGELEMLARGLLGLPRYPLRDAARAARRRCRTSTRRAFGDAARRRDASPGRAERVRRTRPRPARGRRARARRTCAPPRTSFNGRVSPHRRFVFGQLSLDEVKAVKNAHGCTVNDVVVAICAGRGAPLADRARRAARRAARRPDPGLGAQRASSRAPTATGSC